MMRFYRAEDCRQLDRLTIEQQGVPGILLMKRAAWSAFHWLTQLSASVGRMTVVCGAGNNGGDGYVLAQYACLAGWQVSLIQLGASEKIHGDAALARQEWLAMGEEQTLADLPACLSTSDWMVDAIFGTGLEREVTGHYAEAIELMNAAQGRVMALDIASGLSADRGTILGTAVKADYTATFIGAKLGLVTADGVDVSGEVKQFDLGVPEGVFEQVPPVAMSHSLAEFAMPVRPRNSHKGRFGTALLVGGNHAMMGAIQLAGRAALRSGAGLVKIITQAAHQTALTAQQPELMVYDETAFAVQSEQATALAIGPGLGLEAWAQGLWVQALAFVGPKVLDADALTLLAQSPMQRQEWILTPHPAEAARLLGWTTAAVQADRLAALQALQATYGGVVVLKGAGTLVTDGQQVFVCTAGNSGMAVGGMGDVLTGICVSLLAQGMTLFEAACLAVQWHAEAGDRAAERYGKGLLPSDLICSLE